MAVSAGKSYRALTLYFRMQRQAAHPKQFTPGDDADQFAVFAANDEYANAALGLSGPPRAYPVQTHLRGLTGHAVLGMATETGIVDVGDLHRPDGGAPFRCDSRGWHADSAGPSPHMRPSDRGLR